MAFNHSITLIGNLTRDPEIKTAASGKKRALFGMAINEGTGDNEKTNFVNVTAFGDLGEHLAASVKKGARIIAVVRLDQYGKEVQIDGETKEITMTNYIADAVGPDLRWATAQVTRISGNGGSADENPAHDAAPAAAPAGGSEFDGDEPAAQPAARQRSAAPAPDDDF
jgi:single-strand DNA-binding protein